MCQSDHVAQSSQRRGMLTALLIAVISLPVAFVILTMVQEGIHLLWVELANSMSRPALWAMVMVVPTLAGVGVALLRKHGEDGHNPLGGLASNPLTFRQYLSVIAAILVTLLGGLVLGPEVALVSTGAMVGTVLGRRRGDLDEKRAVLIGVIFAVLALFVGPVLTGNFDVAPNYTFAWVDLFGGLAVAAATAGVLTAGRLLSIGIVRLRGGDVPAVWPMAAAGAAIGLIVVGYSASTGNPVSLVLTSGEEQVRPMLALGTASAIALTVAVKWLAYAISMGSGFRGGPYFPALFVGGGIGGIAMALAPSLSQAAPACGLIAALVYLAHPKLPAAAIAGAVLGGLIGGWQLIPAAVVAAVVAALLPEVRLTTDAAGDSTETVLT